MLLGYLVTIGAAITLYLVALTSRIDEEYAEACKTFALRVVVVAPVSGIVLAAVAAS